MICQEFNPVAFKEWAVICAGLDAGVQSLILRKGGIHEGRAGFRVEHREFWLYPTEFHQAPSVVTEAAQPWLAAAAAQAPDPGTLVLRNYVVVDEVLELSTAEQLPRLSGLHLWSAATIEARFHYRTPMLFALIVRVYRASQPFSLEEQTTYAGCRSWVEMERPLSTAGLVPVLSDEDHANRLAAIRQALSGDLAS